EGVLDSAVIAFVYFDPEVFSFEVFQPRGPQVALPVKRDPPANRDLPQIVADALTFAPFIPFGFLVAFRVNAVSFGRGGYRETRIRLQLRTGVDIGLAFGEDHRTTSHTPVSDRPPFHRGAL